MEFSERLKELRERRGLTQEELAEKLSVKRSTIGMLENGSRKPSFETEEEIADFFNVGLDYLRGKEDRTTRYIDPYYADLIENPLLRKLLAAGGKLPEEDLEAFVLAIEAAVKSIEKKNK